MGRIASSSEKILMLKPSPPVPQTVAVLETVFKEVIKLKIIRVGSDAI